MNVLRRTALCALSVIFPLVALASDHSDIPVIGGVARPTLNGTDLHAFTVTGDGDEHLILSMCIDAGVPVPFPPGMNYLFPTDARFRFFIDNAPGPQPPPGALNDIMEDISFDITFNTAMDDAGLPVSVPTVISHGLKKKNDKGKTPGLKVFAGAADDPFIRGPRQGRNVAAIVLRIPLGQVLEKGKTNLRIWAAIEWPDANGNQVEHLGCPLRSMGEIVLNQQHPAFHAGGPDVIVFDVARPAAFPNGRALTDDVVDLVGALEPGVAGKDVRNSEGCGNVQLGTYTNCVTTNESGFSDEFPFLRPAH